MNKKAIAILGAIFLLIVGTLGFLVYSKYVAKKTTDPAPVSQTPAPADTTTPVDTSTTTPVVQQSSNIMKLSEDQVLSPALFFNGSGVTYFDNQGGLFQSSFQDDGAKITLGQKKKLDIPIKSKIKKILWPAKGNDFIAELSGPDGKKSWSYYNSN
ncbi:MAG: hypothetical protein AAB729_05380 [Patescibacteria group bacterium]